jgi:predicted DNA-binding protein
MPLSLRIPSKKEEMIKKAAAKSGKTKSAFILEAVEEKLGLIKGRDQLIREFAGWLSHEEAEKLRESVNIFDKVNQGDWG